MKFLRNAVLPVFLAGIWINISETLRWKLLIEPYWIDHYADLGLIFPADPIHNAAWILWGFILASLVFVLSTKFTLLQTTLIAWIAGFVMLWLVLWNVDVLPQGILWYVVPLSFITTLLAAYICKLMLERKLKKQS